MSYFNNNDNQIIKYFSKKNNKEKINFDIWYKHHEPFLEDIYYDFVYICENNNIKLFNNSSTKQNFYKMLYNTSSGILVDKWDFPYTYGLIKEEDKNDKNLNCNENNKEILENKNNNISSYYYDDPPYQN